MFNAGFFTSRGLTYPYGIGTSESSRYVMVQLKMCGLFQKELDFIILEYFELNGDSNIRNTQRWLAIPWYGGGYGIWKLDKNTKIEP